MQLNPADAQASLTRTAALHGAVGSRVAVGACDVASPFVQIQTFLTFCAKVSTETGLTVLNFAFCGGKTTNHKGIMKPDVNKELTKLLTARESSFLAPRALPTARASL